MTSFPKLIVFDFHTTLSLKPGRGSAFLLGDFETTLKSPEFIDLRINNIKNALRKYKKDSWYDAMKTTGIEPNLLMPTLSDIIIFINDVKKRSPETIFGIATMGESENFMLDLIRYCFESRGETSPFIPKNVIGNESLKFLSSKGKDDKWPHISLILKRNDLDIAPSSIVLIDDSYPVVNYMSSIGVCCILVEEYFTLKDWNKGCYTK